MARKRGKDGLHWRKGVLAFRFKDANEWREKCTGTSDREAAKKYRDDFLSDLKGGTLPTEMAEWRLDQAERWWNEFRKPRTSGSTQNSERYRLQHLRLVMGNKKLKDITNVDLDNYVTTRLTGYTFVNPAGAKTTRPAVGEWTINKEIMLWSLILKKAKLWRRMQEDYKPLKPKASDIGRAITREQLRHLAEVASQNQEWEACFYAGVLAANTGLRGGEIKKLRIGEVDLEGKQLRIRRDSTKSDAGARIVPLNADALEAAARLVLRAGSLQLTATEPQHYLLPKNLSRIAHGRHKGERGYDPNQHAQYWDTAWGSLTEAAGLPGFRFHDLRHSFITHMVERGKPLGLIQAMVGHLSRKMLLHYTHITTGAASEAVGVFNSEPILTPTLTCARPPEKVYRA